MFAFIVDILEPSGTTQTPSTQAVTPQLSELDASDSHLISSTVNESQSVEVSVTVSVEVAEDIDPLDRFLPPPPTAKCSDELQVSAFLNWISPIRSCFLKDCFI